MKLNEALSDFEGRVGDELELYLQIVARLRSQFVEHCGIFAYIPIEQLENGQVRLGKIIRFESDDAETEYNYLKANGPACVRIRTDELGEIFTLIHGHSNGGRHEIGHGRFWQSHFDKNNYHREHNPRFKNMEEVSQHMRLMALAFGDLSGRLESIDPKKAS